MQEINTIRAKAPVAVGDVLLEDVAGTKVAVVATKPAEPAQEDI
jgi:CxxC motif-containing protein